MIFHDHVEAQLAPRILLELQKTVCGRLLLFLESLLCIGCRVHANGMTAKKLCRISSLEMIFHGLMTFGRVRITQAPLAVTHDEQGLNALVLAALLHLGEILLILRLVEEELVYILNGLNAKPARHLGKLKVVQMRLLTLEKTVVQ